MSRKTSKEQKLEFYAKVNHDINYRHYKKDNEAMVRVGIKLEAMDIFL